MAYLDQREDIILVTKPEQMDGLLRSDKIYAPIGMIDLSTVNPLVGSGGAFIQGSDYFISGFYSTADSHIMFASDPATHAGNFRMQNCSLTSSGVGSKLFDVDDEQNGGAIEFNSCNLGDFSADTTEIGELTAYRQFRTNDCGLFRNQDGLTFSGTWSGGFRINDTIVLSQAANSTLFKVGTGLTFAGRCISDINAASVDPTTITFDFVPANFLLHGGFQLTGASFAPNSSISVTTDETSIKSFFRDCVEIRNTRPGYEMVWTTDTNTPLTVDTPTKALGTTVTTNETWFSQTGNNEVTYNSNLINDLRVTADLTVDGGPNDQIRIYVRRWDASGSVYEDVKSKLRNISNVLGQLDVAIFNITARVDDVAIGDRIEIWMENTSDSSGAIVQSGSDVYVEVL